MPTVLVKEFFRNFSGIFPEKFRASYFSGKVTTLIGTTRYRELVSRYKALNMYLDLQGHLTSLVT